MTHKIFIERYMKEFVTNMKYSLNDISLLRGLIIFLNNIPTYLSGNKLENDGDCFRMIFKLLMKFLRSNQ